MYYCINITHNSACGSNLYKVKCKVRSSTRIVSTHAVPIIRRSANYKPCIHQSSKFVQSLTTDYTVGRYQGQVDELKKAVKEMFDDVSEHIDQLELISDVQRLGLAYHFDADIKRTLKNIYENDHLETKDDLHATALKFRLLRQHAFHISEDVFKKFMENGSFKTSVCEDVNGVLSLYEAYYFSSEGDSIMEDAWSFASKILQEQLDNITDPILSMKVRHALKSPLDWRIQRMEARWYIDVYASSNNMNPALLQLAKLDFNIVQGIYQEDLKNVLRFWEELGLAKTLSFARNRPVESFFGGVASIPAPQSRYSRMQLAKQIQLISSIDDIYDVYGTLEEVELFTDAIERWDINSIQQLPDYMKICFLALYNYVNDMVYKVYKEQNIDVLPYLKRGWVDVVKAFCVEARWYHSGYKPTLEEYLKNGVYSIGLPNFVVQYYICSTNPIKEEALQYLVNMPDILISASMLGRILDDNGTSSDESVRGDVAKAIQCYMSGTGVSEEAAHAEMKYIVRKKWREMNKFRAQEVPLSLSFVDTIFNLLRAAHYAYRDGDGLGVQHNDKNKLMLNVFVAQPIPI